MRFLACIDRRQSTDVPRAPTLTGRTSALPVTLRGVAKLGNQIFVCKDGGAILSKI